MALLVTCAACATWRLISLIEADINQGRYIPMTYEAHMQDAATKP